MASPAKYPKKEVTVSDMCLGRGTTVHGAFVGVASPVKSGRSGSKVQYFESLFSDGNKTVRMVSFDPQFKIKVDDAREKREEVAITNCCVQKRKNSDELEIVVGSGSNLIKSPKKFCVDESLLAMPITQDAIIDISKLKELNDLPINQHVNVTGKVKCLESAEEVKSSRTGPLMKQDVILADSTAVYKCVIWEKNIGKFDVDGCYELKDVTVRSFNGSKYLSLSEKSLVTKIEDIGEVVADIITSGIEIEGEIAGVISYETYNSCKLQNCKGKVMDITPTIVQCTKCDTKVKATRCDKVTVARLLIEDTKEGKQHKVSVFNKSYSRHY